MKLNLAESASPLWQKLKEHYEAELARMRARIENPLLAEAERIGLCWRIKEIKELLEMEIPDRKQETDRRQ